MPAHKYLTSDEVAAALAVQGCTFDGHGEGGVEFWRTPDGYPFCLQMGDGCFFDEWQLLECFRNTLGLNL